MNLKAECQECGLPIWWGVGPSGRRWFHQSLVADNDHKPVPPEPADKEKAAELLEQLTDATERYWSPHGHGTLLECSRAGDACRAAEIPEHMIAQAIYTGTRRAERNRIAWLNQEWDRERDERRLQRGAR